MVLTIREFERLVMAGVSATAWSDIDAVSLERYYVRYLRGETVDAIVSEIMRNHDKGVACI
jgi:hypothetical protein